MTADQLAAEGTEPGADQADTAVPTLVPVPTDPVVYRMPPRAVVRPLAIAALCEAAFIALATASSDIGATLAWVIAALGAVSLIRTAVSAIRRKPIMTVDADGISMSIVQLTWPEVYAVTVVRGRSKLSRTGYLAIDLVDANDSLKSLSAGRVRAARRLIAAGDSPLRMPAEAFPVPMEEVLNTMRGFRPGLVSRAGK